MSTKSGRQSTEGYTHGSRWSVEVRVIGTEWWHGHRDSRLDRFRPSDRRNTLRPVSLLDCIEYEMNLRGSLPALYSLGDRVTSRFRPKSIRLYIYIVSIYKEYDIYHIQKDLPSSPRCLLIALRCTSIRAEHRRPWSYGLNLPWWYGPCLLPWVPRVIPPTVSPWAPCIRWPMPSRASSSSLTWSQPTNLAIRPV